jgi:hypothetical protein
MSYHPTRSSSSAALEMMIWLNSLRLPTRGRVYTRFTRLRRAKRLVHVGYSLPAITGEQECHPLVGTQTDQSLTHRSLVTTLRSAEKFDQSHLSSPEVAPLIDAAKLFYVEGYFLTHGTASVLEVSKKASETGKVSISPL